MSLGESCAVDAEPNTARLGGCECSARSFANHLPLVFGEGGHDVENETGCVRHVHGDEVRLGLHECRYERHASGQAVELGDEQCRLLAQTGVKRSTEFRPVALAAALDLDEFRDDGSGSTGKELADGSALRIQTEAGSSLAVCAYAVVGDEPLIRPEMRGRLTYFPAASVLSRAIAEPCWFDRKRK